MTIEFSNAKAEKSYSGITFAILFLSCAFFFIPTTLIVLGYYSSLPTGTLVSPLPQGIVSQQVAPQVTLATPEEKPEVTQQAETNSNLQTKSATLAATQTEVVVDDPDIKPTSQIFLSKKDGDDSIYTLKNKADGQMTIMSTSTSESERVIDYYLVNP